MPYFLAPLWTIDVSELSEDEQWEHFERCLKVHDWTYLMSDDHGVYRAGEEQKDHLHDLFENMRHLDQVRAEKLYYAACPWLNADGSRVEDW